MPRRRPFLTALVAGLIAGTGYPIVDVLLACRAPISEACVWGKAYFPLTLGVSVVLVGGLVTGVLYALLLRRRESHGDDDVR
jgi:xanthosine utilization system XapX-like protein